MAVGLSKTTLGTLSAEMKTFYDRLLLERTVPNLLYSKFAQKRPIPLHGGKIIEFRRFSGMAVATTPLVEGTPPTLKDMTVTSTTATIEQYGDALGFTDLVSTTTIDPILTEGVEVLAEQAAETIDELVRTAVIGGTVVQYCGTGNTARNQIDIASVFSPAEIRLAVLQLKLNRARRIDGFYQAIIHPRTAYDLMNTAEWRDAQNYGQTNRIFDGSLGTLYGVKFWESDKAFVAADASSGAGGAGAIDVFATVIFGQNAYAIVDLAGHNLKTFHKGLGSAGTADPIDQQQSIGWKVGFTTKIINDQFMIRCEHSASTATNV